RNVGRRQRVVTGGARPGRLRVAVDLRGRGQEVVRRRRLADDGELRVAEDVVVVEPGQDGGPVGAVEDGGLDAEQQAVRRVSRGPGAQAQRHGKAVWLVDVRRHRPGERVVQLDEEADRVRISLVRVVLLGLGQDLVDGEAGQLRAEDP